MIYHENMAAVGAKLMRRIAVAATGDRTILDSLPK